MADKKISIQDGVQPEWLLVASYWCDKNGAELLFVNLDSFGCWRDNNPMHIYADELKQMVANQ